MILFENKGRYKFAYSKTSANIGCFSYKKWLLYKANNIREIFNMVLMWRHIKELMEEVALGLLLFTAYWIVWLIRKIWN